jgi:L-idonate 5-dehydrogenase
MRVCVIHAARDIRVEQRADPVLGEGGVLVRVRAGGICGSDLHYFEHGRNGDFVIREPLIPGHEIAGEVEAVGAAVSGIKPGDRVAVHPGRNCGRCRSCREGRGNLCRNVFFMGSASRFPHMQGGFAEYIAIDETQCHKISDGLAFTTAAFAEPLSVALHAIARTGGVLGRTILITGGGPIGLLILLAARHAGAARIAVSDVLDGPLQIARRIGADAALNIAAASDAVTEDARLVDGYDIAIEASGNPAALATCLQAVRPGGTVVQVGTLPPGSFPVAGNLVMAKEIDLRGSMRFDLEFGHAVACLDQGSIDVSPLLTACVAVEDVAKAFGLAAARNDHQKVQIVF